MCVRFSIPLEIPRNDVELCISKLLEWVQISVFYLQEDHGCFVENYSQSILSDFLCLRLSRWIQLHQQHRGGQNQDVTTAACELSALKTLFYHLVCCEIQRLR
jgi:hypothetical protein